MKSLMYHYVRHGREDLPYFRYLHMEDFRSQLNYLQQNFDLISKERFLEAVTNKTPVPNSVVLTFDDGLADHINVAKELLDRGLWGIFYIPTGCYYSKKLINVHRVHMLLGRYGGPAILRALQDVLTESMVVDKDVLKFHDITYLNVQECDIATSYVKKLMNFSILDEAKNNVLDLLMEQYFDDESSLMASYYLTNQQIKSMHDAGMIIGAHSVTHPVFSKLSFAEQEYEIVESFSYLEKIIPNVEPKTFCYPYGGNYVFNQDTLDILNRQNCAFSFSFEQRDINVRDFTMSLQNLPRYDCNQFPHGKASMGVKRPDELDNAP